MYSNGGEVSPTTECYSTVGVILPSTLNVYTGELSQFFLCSTLWLKEKKILMYGQPYKLTYVIGTNVFCFESNKYIFL